jgi:hypothetical protein
MFRVFVFFHDVVLMIKSCERGSVRLCVFFSESAALALRRVRPPEERFDVCKPTRRRALNALFCFALPFSLLASPDVD